MKPLADGATIGSLPRGTICRAGGSDDVGPPTVVSTSMDLAAAVSSAWATPPLARSTASPEECEEPATSEATMVAFTPTARGRVEDSTTVARTPIAVLGALAAGGEPILLESPALQIGKGWIWSI